MNDIFGRKADHLDLAATGDVAFKKTHLLECVELLHDAMPELDFPEIDLGCQVLGKRMQAPILIAAMTGGTERAMHINRSLAAVAEELGLGFGLGSQRAMHLNPTATSSYQVREQAPTALLLGNIGAVQAIQMSRVQLSDLVEAVGADGLCIHLNPAMELIQVDGDRAFRGISAGIERLVRDFPVPIIVKETGCGISGSVARRLRGLGVSHVDVSGAGGTSWVAVEVERAAPHRRSTGEQFREWGIPTAATVMQCSSQGFETIIATGGIATGIDAARAIALGAGVVGIARPVLVAFEQGGNAAVRDYLMRVQVELRMAMLLCGAPNLATLRKVPRIIRSPLAEWSALNA